MTGETEAKAWLADSRDKDFAIMINDIHSDMLAYIENKRSKKENVTVPMYNNIKKALDFISNECTKLSTENKVLKARIEDRQEYSELMKNLAQKLSRPSTGSLSDLAHKDLVPSAPKKVHFSVIVSPLDEGHDLQDIKAKIKEICKDKDDAPPPSDVLTTKANQVILKLNNQKDAERVKNILMDSEIKDKVKINTPRHRRERVLILSVDPEVGESDIKKELRRLLDESASDGITRGLARKLTTPILDQATKSILEELYMESSLNFHIIRKIPTKQNKNNWLIDVDADGKAQLLERKKICLDYERYRMVEYIPVTRCFKCQQYGHFANSCSNDMRCANCAADHETRSCKSDAVCCANCYFDNVGGYSVHRADSAQCPVFLKYRASLLPNRS